MKGMVPTFHKADLCSFLKGMAKPGSWDVAFPPFPHCTGYSSIPYWAVDMVFKKLQQYQAISCLNDFLNLHFSLHSRSPTWWQISDPLDHPLGCRTCFLLS